MINFVCTFHKIWLGGVYSDLKFTIDLVIEPCINHDVTGYMTEPILDTYNFKLFRVLVTDSFNLIEDFRNLSLFGRILAS